MACGSGKFWGFQRYTGFKDINITFSFYSGLKKGAGILTWLVILNGVFRCCIGFAMVQHRVVSWGGFIFSNL